MHDDQMAYRELMAAATGPEAVSLS
jgi:hypothetical protein